MPITFSCSSCKARMTVPDTLAGKRGKCSKCKAPVEVPLENGAAEPGVVASTVAASTAAPAHLPGKVTRIPGPPSVEPSTLAPGGSPSVSTTLPPAPPTPPPPAPEPPASLEPTVDLESEAAAALADEPKETRKVEYVEFNCPQCDEPLKMALDLAGKRAPCPECRRIIPVPIPRTATPADWRNAGPKLPAGAKRDDGPAPEGAWGTGVGGMTRASTEALQEAGVIKEKAKPLTFYQRYQPYMMIGGPLLLLLVGSLVVWNWLTRNQERRALNEALSLAAAKDAPRTLGGEGLMALFGHAGNYFLATQKPGCASLAREQFGKVVVVGKSVQGTGGDALLGDLTVDALALAGGPEETDTDRKLSWKETQRIVRALLEGIDSQGGRVAALRQVTARLVELNHTESVLQMVASVTTMTGADRAEVLGVVGLELDRLGKKEESARALTEALVPYEEPKTKDDKKPRERPPLRAPVVALARLHGKPPPPPGKSLEDQENSAVGEADALARQGKLDEARALARTVPVQGGGRLRLLIAVAAAAHESKVSNDEVQPALDAVSSGSRPELSWPLLRLVEVGLAAGTSPDKLESAIAAIVDPNLAAWARLQMLRKQLASSRAVEPAELLDKIPPATAAGMLARLELSRHNLRRDSGWASTVRSWDDGPRALGSLGVALGLQGSK